MVGQPSCMHPVGCISDVCKLNSRSRELLRLTQSNLHRIRTARQACPRILNVRTLAAYSEEVRALSAGDARQKQSHACIARIGCVILLEQPGCIPTRHRRRSSEKWIYIVCVDQRRCENRVHARLLVGAVIASNQQVTVCIQYLDDRIQRKACAVDIEPNLCAGGTNKAVNVLIVCVAEDTADRKAQRQVFVRG